MAEPELGLTAMGSVFCQDWALPVRDHAEFQEITERSLALSSNTRGSVLGQAAAAGRARWLRRAAAGGLIAARPRRSGSGRTPPDLGGGRRLAADATGNARAAPFWR
ncbi:hypothetical protein GCM10010428_10190 [Actinosynnema pretiosum subsp. pretiosum]